MKDEQKAEKQIISTASVGRGTLLGMLSVFFVMSLCHAEEVQVVAGLSANTASVGQPVQLSVRVDGARTASVPDNFAVEGLRILPSGQQKQVQMINFQLSVSTTFTFTVIPTRPGDFTIPALAVDAGGKTYQTQPLQLSVTAGGGQANVPIAPAVPSPSVPPAQTRSPLGSPGTGNPPRTSVPEDEVAWIELIVPQTEVYVGQVVPIEIRLFLDRRFRFDLQQMPTLSGEGFTMERLTEPTERAETINGVPYQIVTFYSAVTALKTGVLSLGPVELEAGVMVPSRNMGSLFDDFFGGDPFGERRILNIQSKPVDLQARSLPKDGRPVDFTGAIGQFDVMQNISTPRGKVGDPMQMSIKIVGRGNFGLVAQPTLENLDGWRSYPGSSRFEPRDSVGFSGEKVFDVTILPLREAKTSPTVRFSYFDPVAEEYKTVTTESVPVEILAGAAVAAAATPKPVVVTVPEEESAPDPATEPAATAPQAVPAAVFVHRDFRPLLFRPEFFAANSAAAIAALCILSAAFIRHRSRGVGAKIAAIQKEQKTLLESLKAKATTDEEFFSSAIRYLVNLQRVLKKDPEAGIAVEDLPSFATTEEAAERVRAMLSAYNELQYSGRKVRSFARDRESALAFVERPEGFFQ